MTDYIDRFDVGETEYELRDSSAAHSASDFTSGTLPIARGGTGATTAAAALTNLGAAPAYSYGTDDLTAGTSALATGKLYFVYE